jgi:uncharacterized iron-regulated membrane protein
MSGVVMWWSRRPERALRLVAPARPRDLKAPAIAGVSLLVVCGLFPLAGAAVAFVVLLDVIVIQRVSWLQALVN